MDRKTDNPWYQQFNGGWIETSAIARDAVTPFGVFDEVAWEEAAPGMLLVYGDRRVDGKKKEGHVGIISVVGEAGPEQAIHCSAGNFRRTGDAIQETGVGAWKLNHGLVARCALVSHGA